LLSAIPEIIPIILWYKFVLFTDIWATPNGREL